MLKALQKNIQDVLMAPTAGGLDQILPQIQAAAARTQQLAAVAGPVQQLAKLAQTDVTTVQEPEPVPPIQE